MAAAPSLDQLVKGSPAPSNRLRSLSATSALSASSADSLSSQPQSYPSGASDSLSTTHPSTTDPLSTLPSSPPQIYLNLLILESSLRAQYLALRERRRQNTFFLLLLAAWIAYFSYALFLRPREDGRGVGGSVYWVVEMWERVALLGGVVTALLVWGTGQWERGIRWPRRWLAIANRGLRTMNTKIVVIRGPWWQELLSYLSFLFPFSTPFSPSAVGDFHYLDRPLIEKRSGRASQQYYYNMDSESGLVEEDLSPGGDHIRLLLLPKLFSPEFRGNWDDYRTDYWEKENERRSQIREKLRQRERQIARQEGAWFWWIGIGWKASRRRRQAAATLHRTIEGDKGHRHHHHPNPSISKLAHESKSPLRRSTRSGSHSRTPSRSSTPIDTDDRPPSRSSATSRPRRGSNTPSSAASGSEHTPNRRRKGSKTLNRGLSPLTQAQIREGVRTSSFSSDDSSSITGLSLDKEKKREDSIES
ncbi:Spo7-like protein-domain-containing protein [Aspergillus keveii]|uniref:Spo7-like protein-domain-containing protein n=1 Tax=Aspergillus keveii TaxID=714993 RepID=A0ABR4GJV1_9EURO